MSLCDALCRRKGSKDPDATRHAVLKAAYEEIHRQGFQSASLANILAATGLTKGALYHHFANKQQLGYAVLDEVIRPDLTERWIAPIQVDDANPIDTLTAVIMQAGETLSEDDIVLGCPLNNLSQEMSPVDEGFRERIRDLYAEWREALCAAFVRGKHNGQVRADVDEAAAATFIVGALEGCVGMAKNARSRDVLMQCGLGILAYLESLRP